MAWLAVRLVRSAGPDLLEFGQATHPGTLEGFGRNSLAAPHTVFADKHAAMRACRRQNALLTRIYGPGREPEWFPMPLRLVEALLEAGQGIALKAVA